MKKAKWDYFKAYPLQHRLAMAKIYDNPRAYLTREERRKYWHKEVVKSCMKRTT